MNENVTLAHAESGPDHWWFAGRRSILTAIATECLEPKQEPHVVDLGCSVGHNSLICGDRWRYLGIDPSIQAISLAATGYSNHRFIHGAVGEPAVDENRRAADLVLLTDVLEHVADDVALLQQVVQELTPGAHLIVTVPADMALWSPHDVSLGHYRRYDAENLSALWSGLPVDVQLISPFNSRLYWPIWLVRKFNSLFRTAWGDANTDLRTKPGFLDSVLQKLFASEQGRLLDLMRGERCAGFGRGVSLMAVLQRRNDNEPNTKPQYFSASSLMPISPKECTLGSSPPSTGVLPSHSKCIIVVPCFNEAGRLDIDAFSSFALDHDDVAFLFVNDGSSDDTRELLASLASRFPLSVRVLDLPANCGKAEAVRQGALAALEV